MAKRARPLKLKLAKNAGWLAEFPDDLWHVIIQYLPTEKPHDIPDLGLMLSLMGVNKALCMLFTSRVMTLLSESMSFVQNNEQPKGPSRLFWRISLFLEGIKEAGMDLRLYMTKCVTDKAYHTPEHLTNCVSLLNLANREMTYLKSYTWRTGPGKMYYYSPLVTLSKHCINWELQHVKYMKTTKTKLRTTHVAITLPLMKDIGTVRHYMHAEPVGESSLYLQASNLLKEIGDENDPRLVKLRTLSRIGDRLPLRAMVVDILTEKAPIKTAKPRNSDHMEDLLVTIDGRQHYFFSEATQAFRDKCFYSKLNVKDATQAYLLDAMHKRNWAVITKSDRFKV